MPYYEFQNGQLQERMQGQLSGLRARRDAEDADRNAAAWKQHAQKLEARLQVLGRQLQLEQLATQQAQDNERAIRAVSDVHRETVRALQAELAKVDPMNGLANVEKVREACRKEIDDRLAKGGLVMDRRDPNNVRIYRK